MNLLNYVSFQKEIKGLAKVEQVLMDTADSVMDTKRKIEFGVQQIIYKVNTNGTVTTRLHAISWNNMP